MGHGLDLRALCTPLGRARERPASTRTRAQTYPYAREVEACTLHEAVHSWWRSDCGVMPMTRDGCKRRGRARVWGRVRRVASVRGDAAAADREGRGQAYVRAHLPAPPLLSRHWRGHARLVVVALFSIGTVRRSTSRLLRFSDVGSAAPASEAAGAVSGRSACARLASLWDAAEAG